MSQPKTPTPSYAQAKAESDAYRQWPKKLGTYTDLKTNQPKARV
jgi:hypothetical protein